eukprot:6712881-Alexandrium_andersonii.AAC.1
MLHAHAVDRDHEHDAAVGHHQHCILCFAPGSQVCSGQPHARALAQLCGSAHRGCLRVTAKLGAARASQSCLRRVSRPR